MVENDTIRLPDEWRGKFTAPVLVTVQERRDDFPAEGRSLTEQINAVYDKLEAGASGRQDAASLEAWRELTKYDSW